LIVVKQVLRLAQEFGVLQIQFFGDLLLVIQWMHKETTLRNFTLQHLHDEVQLLFIACSHISLSHIYWDKNKIINGLSKVGLGMDR
jgi:hypothetical protein